MTTQLSIADVEPRVARRGARALTDPLARGARRYGGLYLWALMIAVFSVWVPDTFLTSTTVRSIAGEQAITAIVALGLIVPLASGEFDLSVGHTLGLASVVVSWLTVDHAWPWQAAAAAAVAGGIVVGVVNAIAVTRFHVSSFIATLATSSILAGVILALSDNQQIGPLPDGFKSVARHELIGLPTQFWVMAVLAVAVWYGLEHTPIGRRLYALGGGREAARLAGIRATPLLTGAFVVSGTFAAIAGVVLTAKLGSGSPTVGPPYLLPVFAAAFLGSTQLKMRFNVIGTIVAIYLLATGVRGLQLAGAEPWLSSIFNGAALLVAVALAARWSRSHA